MKVIRIAVIAVIIGIGLGIVFREWYTAPEVIDPASYEIPSRSDLNKIRQEVREKCRIPVDGATFDQRTYGFKDFWIDCRAKGVGDCEDHAIAFLEIFQERYPHLEDAVKFHVGWVRNPHTGKFTDYHAIAIVDVGIRYVFDIQEYLIYSWNEKDDSYRELTEAKRDGFGFKKVVRSFS